ncbi:PAP/25A associated domain-containing protein [Aphelenchoides avenae]|nr:PAP/25A associated domain-containing protein [Aphelenchus avenae]
MSRIRQHHPATQRGGHNNGRDDRQVMREVSFEQLVNRRPSDDRLTTESGYLSESHHSPPTDNRFSDRRQRREDSRHHFYGPPQPQSTGTFRNDRSQMMGQPFWASGENDPALRYFSGFNAASHAYDGSPGSSYSPSVHSRQSSPRGFRQASHRNYQPPGQRQSPMSAFYGVAQTSSSHDHLDYRRNSTLRYRGFADDGSDSAAAPANFRKSTSSTSVVPPSTTSSSAQASTSTPSSGSRKLSLVVDDVSHELSYRLENMLFDSLSEQIARLHESVTQPEELYQRKLELRPKILEAIQTTYEMAGLYIVGSSLNGFATGKSDMDMCLMLQKEEMDQRIEAREILQSIMPDLEGLEFVTSVQLIPAKVPILRMKFAAPYDDIVVDLNANNPVGIRNTHLLNYYSEFDWRVRPLVSVVKEWAKRRGINDANRSSFTSYSLVLLVIHYLQCGTSPPVLPSLQKLYPARFNHEADVRKMCIKDPLDPPPEQVWKKRNEKTLGDLLLGFFEYYAKHFNFDEQAISVRLGYRVSREYVVRSCPQRNLSQWRCVCIEEPFTQCNTAHSIHDERVFADIKRAFREGYETLDSTQNLDALLRAADNHPVIPAVASACLLNVEIME